MNVRIHPSILNADHDNMRSEFELIEAAGVEGIHLDIMDGRFVPPVTFEIETIHRYTAICDLQFDAHLMIVQPEKYVDGYIDAGCSLVNFHLEVTADAPRLIDYLHAKGIQAGVTINPNTPVDEMISVAHLVDLVLFMSVYPGYGGQRFIPDVLDKVRAFKRHCTEHELDPLIQIDGGINPVTAPLTAAAGVNTLVAGTFIFRSDDYAERIGDLRKSCADMEPDW
ncbi:MAG: ribulose-phosphate 3-epimerase [Candidatus Glassbacteria bacterium]|nr:ribulose-phosphate 3-epimerase [Candidatus Glassbacteria bacterium]